MRGESWCGAFSSACARRASGRRASTGTSLSRGAAESLDERFGDPGGPDPGEAASSGASASSMRKRAAQSLNPEMGRMGAEDPSTAFPVVSLVDTHFHLQQLAEPNYLIDLAVTPTVP